MAISDRMAKNLRNENVLRITDFSMAGTNLVVAWRSKPVHTYRIEASSTLTNWVGGSSLNSQGLISTTILPDAGASVPFYFRVVED